MMGREMQEIVPVAFLPENHALAIAAMSYNGKLDFGLLGDYDAVPDLEKMADFFEESLDELLEAAGKPRTRKRARSAKPAKKAAPKAKAKPKASAKPAAAKAKPRPKRTAAANGASSNGKGAKRPAMRGKAQRPRLIDSD
jgi:hypothetical protein